MSKFNYAKKLAEIKSYHTWTLQDLADCMAPDSKESAGAKFLANVRDDTLERVQGISMDDFERETEDLTHEIADAAVPVYTGEKWATFTDLGAYQEDVFESSGGSTDMDQLGSVALCMIAERLVSALLAELAEAIEEDDNEA